MRFIAALLLVICLASAGWAEDLAIQLPEGAKAVSAQATNSWMKLSTAGKVEGGVIRFTNVLPLTPYEVTITLADGTVLQGVPMQWYNQEPVDAKKDPLTDDDRTEIAELVKPDKDFFNKQEIIHLAGDHNRATALVKMVRDRAFHSDKGGEIICRFDVWYFRFEASGWMKVQQAQKMLRRDRFESAKAYEQTITPIRWLPELGGITLAKGAAETTVTLTSTAGVGKASSTTRAAD